MKKRTLLIRIAITLLIAVTLYYFYLPPINPTSLAFWSYIIFIFISYLISGIITLLNTNNNIIINKNGIKGASRSLFISIVCIMGLILGIIITNFILSPIFISKQYYKRIVIDTSSEFVSDVKQVDIKSLPLLDKDSSQKLGDRVMGQMPELVSQFDVSDLYSQINYNNSIIRITPLAYNGLIKYFANRNGGVKGYITVDSVSGESRLIKLEQGMKYMRSAYFFEDLYRKLRLTYPTEIFGKENFEIDNEGNPYWIVPTLTYHGVEIRREITGVVILNPITGESKKYKLNDIPKWVDHVYPADLVIEQINDWGKYQNGFINSILGQKGVVQTTQGYNYTVMNDDVYLYTGITSAIADESNIGFTLTNLRTKNTRFYSVPGAEEYSAMASAEGQVQQMNYKASFPLLINLNDNPTYLMSLKDNAGLVKRYALVDVVDYQKVVVTEAKDGIEKAFNNYLGDVRLDVDEKDLLTKNITIQTISHVIIDGNTYYYFTDLEGKKYSASIKINRELLPFLNVNDVVQVFYKNEENIIEIIEIRK